MAEKESTQDLTIIRTRQKKSELVIWLLMPLVFTLGAGVSALLHERYGAMGVAFVAGVALVGAFLVVIWPTD